MKSVLLAVLAVAIFSGCTATNEEAARASNQAPRFGQPQSTIPWNQPEQWEQGGQLGSMPGFNQPH
jgi:outer membrane biogenesis lipoprotein LolB